MARMARLVVPFYPHHCTQRGNRRQPVFFCDDDYLHYKKQLVDALEKAAVEVWAYCFMPNHVHLVVVPQTVDGLRAFFGEAHRRYSRYINFREGWRGYLWQGRFASYVMQEQHLLAAVRYVENNPVEAKLCDSAKDWRWSSVHAHLAGKNDALVRVSPMLDLAGDWSSYLSQRQTANNNALLEKHMRSGRPLGDDAFIDDLAKKFGGFVKAGKAGPKKRRR